MSKRNKWNSLRHVGIFGAAAKIRRLGLGFGMYHVFAIANQRVALIKCFLVDGALIGFAIYYRCQASASEVIW